MLVVSISCVDIQQISSFALIKKDLFKYYLMQCPLIFFLSK